MLRRKNKLYIEDNNYIKGGHEYIRHIRYMYKNTKIGYQIKSNEVSK